MSDSNLEQRALKYKKSADNGSINAMNNYAVMLENGKGVAMNKEEAARYYKIAADKGDIYAMYNYALILENGKGVAMNKEEAARYYKMAADNGDIDAMNNYAVMLENGEGIPMDKKAAAEYYKMAANKGHVYAIYNYALMLENGEGVTIDEEEAAIYFKMAADKGHVDAMYNYAIMLENGEGIPMDKKAAAQYYKMAAARGNVKAKKLLANIGKTPIEVEQLEMENNTIDTIEINSIDESSLKNFLERKGYIELKKLGKGGFGEVYKMEKDGKSYAVKIPIIKEKNAKTSRQLKEDEELQTLINLSGGGHTKKIDGFNIRKEGEEKIYQIEIFKLRKKNNLSKILKLTNNNISNISKISLISQLAIAYKKMHSNGIIHGDIKPANILFNNYNRVKIADYGLSKIGKNHVRSGTVKYMAPEVMNFKDKNKYVNEKSDVYSIGIMFLKILTGKMDLDLMEPLYIEQNEMNRVEFFKYLSNIRNNKKIDCNELRNLIYQISFQDLFPFIEGKGEIIGEIREKLIELITEMLEKNPKKRLSSNQVAEKCGEIFKISNLSKTELENFRIFDKDLYFLGIFNEDTLGYQKNKIKGDLELLLEERLDDQDDQIDQNIQIHLNTLTGKKELSTECKNCLENLLECFAEEGEINLNLDNEAFKENMEKIRKSGNQREYLLIINKILDIKELKMSNEIFRLEEEEKRVELEKLKEKRGSIMLKHIGLSRLSNSFGERGNDKKAKEELEKLVKISNTLSPSEEKKGIGES